MRYAAPQRPCLIIRPGGAPSWSAIARALQRLFKPSILRACSDPLRAFKKWDLGAVDRAAWKRFPDERAATLSHSPSTPSFQRGMDQDPAPRCLLRLRAANQGECTDLEPSANLQKVSHIVAAVGRSRRQLAPCFRPQICGLVIPKRVQRYRTDRTDAARNERGCHARRDRQRGCERPASPGCHHKSGNSHHQAEDGFQRVAALQRRNEIDCRSGLRANAAEVAFLDRVAVDANE